MLQMIFDHRAFRNGSAAVLVHDAFVMMMMMMMMTMLGMCPWCVLSDEYVKFAAAVDVVAVVDDYDDDSCVRFVRHSYGL